VTDQNHYERVIDLMVTIHHWTDRAVLVSIDGNREKSAWLPLSQIEIETYRDQTAIMLSEKLATDKGLV
jgi:hypothetical protein